MKEKIINISDASSLPIPGELTPEEEAEIIAQYKQHRTLESLEGDYHDFDKQVAEGVQAEQLLKKLQNESNS